MLLRKQASEYLRIYLSSASTISLLPFWRPLLTTINAPREELGMKAFAAWEKMLQLKRHKGAEYTLEAELVVLKSTGPARKGKLRK
jgi:DNA-binding LacI/PurR family transcriptional regulator